MVEVGEARRFDNENRATQRQKPRRDRAPLQPCGSRERLRSLDPIPQPPRALQPFAGLEMAGAVVAGGTVDQHVRVKTDHRSCGSSRVKHRPPSDNPSGINATACSMLCGRVWLCAATPVPARQGPMAAAAARFRAPQPAHRRSLDDRHHLTRYRAWLCLARDLSAAMTSSEAFLIERLTATVLPIQLHF